MQCAACHAEYSDALDACPGCSKSATTPTMPATAAEKRSARAPRPETRLKASSVTSAAALAVTNETPTATATQPAPPVSTLIEFPGTGRSAPRPQWRKDLSERVREIQQRRAREAASENQAVPETGRAEVQTSHDTVEDAGPSLGLVPPRSDAPEPNPIVVAALRRIERARQPSQSPRLRGKSNGMATAAAAVAYVPEENLRAEEERATEASETTVATTPSVAASVAETKNAFETFKAEPPAEHVRQSTLVVVSTQPPTKAGAMADDSKPAAHTNEATKAAVSDKVLNGKATSRRTVPRTLDAASLERREEEITDAANTVPVVANYSYSDRAPLPRRILAAAADLLLVGVFSIPFAAIIELTSGNWTDLRVKASMGGIIMLMLFLYLVVSTGLVGRTLGMWALSLRAVDARTALVPTTDQSVRRALLYMLSLVTFGIGLLYSLFDAEGRTAHDHLSGTIVVRE